MDDSFNKKYLEEHERKLKECYDKTGNTFDVILVYADVENLDSFHVNYYNYLSNIYSGKIEPYDIGKRNSFGYFIDEKSIIVQRIYH